jgi:hypothetical protein
MEIIANSLLDFLTYSTLAVYSLSLILILIYSLTQLNMLRYFLKYLKNKQALNTTEPKLAGQK